MSLRRILPPGLSVLLGAFFGAAGGYLAGSLDVPAIIIGALLGAACFVLLWRRWRPGLVAVPLLLVVLFAAWTFYSLYSAGQIMVPTDSHTASFDRLWSAVSAAYPYFDDKGVDWDAVRAAYRPRAEAAASAADYQAVVAEMLAELHDGHTNIAEPFPPLVWRFGALSDIEGEAVITGLDEAARAAGLARGDVVVRLDGRTVDEALAALPPRLRVGSTPWNARAWGLSNLLALWGDASSLEVEARGADAQPRTVTLTAPPRTEISPAAPSIIGGQRLPSGNGLIRIPQFYGAPRAELVAQFDAALDALSDAPGLILDLRGNDGGSSLTASEMAGRLLADSFNYAREYYRLRLPARLWLGVSQRWVYPRAPRYAGPVVLLIDARVVSSAEEFALMLLDSGRARSVGRTSGGSSGNPLLFPLPGGALARFSSGDLRRASGERLEGAGITPDVTVVWTIDAVRAGRDPDIAEAEALLGG